MGRDQLKCVMFCIDTTIKDKNVQRNERLRFWRKETQNPFSDSFGFKNPILDFLEETHEWVILDTDPIAAPALLPALVPNGTGQSRESLVRSPCSRRGLRLKFVGNQSQAGKCFTCNCKVIWLIIGFYMSQRFLLFFFLKTAVLSVWTVACLCARSYFHLVSGDIKWLPSLSFRNPRPPPEMSWSSMAVCQCFLKGSCRFGDRCRDEHPTG